jgi:hypothetical protein
MAAAVKENERRPLFISRPAKPVAAEAGPVILFTAGGVRFAVQRRSAIVTIVPRFEN